MSAKPAEDTKLNRLLRWQAGETPGPWEILVYPTNRCDLKCKICWQRWAEAAFGKVDYESEVDDERLLRLVDEGAEMGVREWTIAGGGEPMLRGRLVMALCERICELGMNGRINSNGTIFTEEQFETFIRVGWDRITVSLDGPTAEINDDIRSERSFERATKNLRLLDTLRRRHKVTKPASAITTVVTARNFDKLDKIVELAHELGCSGVGTLALLVQGDLCAGFALSPEQQAELPKHIECAVQTAQRLGMDQSYADLLSVTDIRQSQDIAPAKWGLMGDGRFSDSLCFEGWLTMSVIAENGWVGPCCGAWDREMQSIKDKSLKEIWLGPYFEKVRAQLLTRKEAPNYCKLCASCLVIRTEEIRKMLLAWDASNWAGMDFRERAVFAAQRVFRNLRQRGPRETFRRAREWWLTYRH